MLYLPNALVARLKKKICQNLHVTFLATARDQKNLLLCVKSGQ